MRKLIKIMFFYYILKNMTSVVLSTVQVTTDAYASLYLSNVTFSTISLSWQNVSSNSSDFRIVDASNSAAGTDVSGTISVSAGSTGSYTVSSLVPGTAYKYYLERYEIDTWIRQTSTNSLIDYVEATTYSTSTTLNVSSTSAQCFWNNPIVGQRYRVTVEKSDDQSTLIERTIGSRDETGEVIFGDLEQGVSYILKISVEEGNAYYEIAQETFTTSSAAAMEVVEGPMASYIVLDWTSSVDGKGSNYRIVNRVSGSGSDSDSILVESSTDTVATIRNLTPGESYVFVLQRLELDGTWDDQTQISTTALTSSLSVSSIGSTTIELSWSQISSNSEYEILYSSSGGTIGSGRTSDLYAILRDLSPGTSYTLQLVTYELGEAVGLASLGTSIPGSTSGMNLNKIHGLIVALALVLFFIMRRKF